MVRRTPPPLYACVTCGGRVWWRLNRRDAWTCSGCHPFWAAVAALVEQELAAAEVAGPEGIRPALAFSDAGVVAEEHALDCASAARFLPAVAAAR